jgi:hypothetical protein
MQVNTAGTGALETVQFTDELAKLKQRIETIEQGLRTGQLGNSSVENGSISFYDADGNERTRIGKQPDGSYVGGAPIYRTFPPTVPKPPIVTGGLGHVKVESDGPTTGSWPADFSHLNVYVSPDGTAGVKIGSIVGRENSIYIYSPATVGNVYTFWLTSVNLSGAESAPSEVRTGVPSQLVGQDILDGAIGELQLANDAVTEAKIAAGAVGTAEIQGQAIDLSKLADGSVSAAQLIDGAVQTEKIAAGAVVTELLAANAVAAGNIAASAITTEKLAAEAVSAEKIAAFAISAEKIAANAVTADKILALNITSDKIAANAIAAGMIQAGAITAAKLEADMIITKRIIAGTANGARSEMHPSDGFQAYNSTGILVARFGGTTGAAYLKGTIESGSGVGLGPTALMDGAIGAYKMYPNTSNQQYILRTWTSDLTGGGVGPVMDLYHVSPTNVRNGPYLHMEVINETSGAAAIWMGFRPVSGANTELGAMLKMGHNPTNGAKYFGLYIPDGPGVEALANGQVTISGGTTGNDPYYALGADNSVQIRAQNNQLVLLMTPDGVGWFGDTSFNNGLQCGPSGSNGIFNNGVGKTFVIDHPDDPDRYLVHASTESPVAGVEYWGTCSLINGYGEVELPPYFESLCTEENRVVILTPVVATLDRPAPKIKNKFVPKRPTLEYTDVRTGDKYKRQTPNFEEAIPALAATYPKNGRFQIRAGASHSNVLEVNWLVKAVRRNTPVVNEPMKSDVTVQGDGPYTYIDLAPELVRTQVSDAESLGVDIALPKFQ